QDSENAHEVAEGEHGGDTEAELMPEAGVGLTDEQRGDGAAQAESAEDIRKGEQAALEQNQHDGRGAEIGGDGMLAGESEGRAEAGARERDDAREGEDDQAGRADKAR